MAKGRSKQQQGKYASYKTSQTWAKNRRAKLDKHLKAHPNDTQAVTATKNITYSRKTPKTTVWSATILTTAQLIKIFEGRVNYNIFNANDIVRNTARMSHKGKTKPFAGVKQMFSLATRAHDKNGVAVW